MSKSTKQFLVGKIFPSKYGDLCILEYHNKQKILIKFLLSGHEKYTQAQNIRQGTVKDPYYPNVAVVGFVGLADTSVGGKVKQSYHVWRGMLRRCYEEHKNGLNYFHNVSVCEAWWCFEEYEKWYDSNYIEGFDMDKDFTKINCNLYSPDTCSFIPNRVNSILGKKKYNKNRIYVDLPVGVSYHKRDEQYTAQCYDGVQLVHLGYFSSKDSAFLIYKNYKENLIKSVATEYYNKKLINPTVYNNLMAYEVTP